MTPRSKRAGDGMAPGSHRFEPAADAWLAGLGLVRDAVRQELVRRQLAANLPARDRAAAGARRRMRAGNAGHCTGPARSPSRRSRRLRDASRDRREELRRCCRPMCGNGWTSSLVTSWLSQTSTSSTTTWSAVMGWPCTCPPWRTPSGQWSEPAGRKASSRSSPGTAAGLPCGRECAATGQRRSRDLTPASTTTASVSKPCGLTSRARFDRRWRRRVQSAPPGTGCGCSPTTGGRSPQVTTSRSSLPPKRKPASRDPYRSLAALTHTMARVP